MADNNDRLLAELEEAEKKAWDSLSRYKFAMFGYWAGVWVHLNRVGGFKKANPWRDLVGVARDRNNIGPNMVLGWLDKGGRKVG